MNTLEYENYQEKKDHVNLLVPYTTYLCSVPLDFTFVPTHWHDEIEIIYVKKGEGIITVDLISETVTAGTLVLVLPGQLHSIGQYGHSKMEYETIIFHPNLLLSRQTDHCSQDFFLPLFSNTLSVPSFFTPSFPYYKELVNCIDQADEICKTFPKAFLFGLKAQLFQFFYVLFSNGNEPSTTKNIKPSLDKMKKILKYIEYNYHSKITIEAIAQEIGVSQSHFMRYFRNTMGTSFVEYLNEYRLTKATHLLLTSEDSILTISTEVGIDNLSYFNRMFKKRFHTTPSKYRKSR